MFTCLAASLWFLAAPLLLAALVYLGLRAWLYGSDLSRFDTPAIARTTERTQASPEIEEVHQLLRGLAEHTGPILAPGRLGRMRQMFDEGFGDGPRDGTELGITIEPVVEPNVKGEWLVPKDHVKGRRFLYIHGGAFMLGSSLSHRPLTLELARRTRASVFSLDYRLMPEHTRRASIEDAQRGYRYMLESGPPQDTAPPETLYIAGDSAGGNLAAMLLPWARDEGLRPVDAAVLFSPATDMTLASPTLQENLETDVMLGRMFRLMLRWPLLRGLKQPRFMPLLSGLLMTRIHPCNPLISPLRADLSGLPPVLVQASECEVLLGDSRRFVNKAAAAGSPALLQTWPGMVHVWQIFHHQLPEAREALDRMDAFLAAATETS